MCTLVTTREDAVLSCSIHSKACALQQYSVSLCVLCLYIQLAGVVLVCRCCGCKDGWIQSEERCENRDY